MNPSVWCALKTSPTKQSCALSWIEINLMGLLQMKKAHVHPSLHAFYKSRFPSLGPLEHCRHCKWKFLQLSRQSTPSHSFFSSFFCSPPFFPHFFIPSSQSPGGVCGQLVLPQWRGDFLGSAGLGSDPPTPPFLSLYLGPSHLAPRASRPGLGSSEACVFHAQGKACMPLSPRQTDRVWGHGLAGAFAMWYFCKALTLSQPG